MGDWIEMARAEDEKVVSASGNNFTAIRGLPSISAVSENSEESHGMGLSQIGPL